MALPMPRLEPPTIAAFPVSPSSIFLPPCLLSNAALQVWYSIWRQCQMAKAAAHAGGRDGVTTPVNLPLRPRTTRISWGPAAKVTQNRGSRSYLAHPIAATNRTRALATSRTSRVSMRSQPFMLTRPTWPTASCRTTPLPRRRPPRRMPGPLRWRSSGPSNWRYLGTRLCHQRAGRISIHSTMTRETSTPLPSPEYLPRREYSCSRLANSPFGYSNQRI